MTAPTEQEIQKLADLSKLHIANDVMPVLSQHLKNTLDLVEKINDIPNLADIEPLAHPFTHIAQPLRDDIVKEKNDRALLQKNAPRTEAGLYIVTKFVESE